MVRSRPCARSAVTISTDFVRGNVHRQWCKSRGVWGVYILPNIFCPYPPKNHQISNLDRTWVREMESTDWAGKFLFECLFCWFYCPKGSMDHPWIIVLIIQQLGFHTTLLENSTKFVCLVNWTYLYFGESGDSSPLSVEKNRNAHQPSWTTQSSPVRKLFHLTSLRLEAIPLLDSHFENGCWNVGTATVTAKLIIN